MKNDGIMVSICCLTFNHKDYIEETIESFLKQKTTFKYEIIIHDDCSTDGTIEILKKYKKKYPKTIKLMLEKENQYSKNIKIEPMVFKESCGKYIAFCEGDDYWSDENKLQKQFDFMENNSNYSLLVHDALLYMQDIHSFRERKCAVQESRDCSIEEIILGTGVGGSFPTCSMFFKCDIVKELPDFFMDAPVGDMPLMLFLGLRGKIYYMKDSMAVYRCNTPGSWSVRIQNRTNEEVISSQKRFDDMMLSFNQFSDCKYDKEVRLYLLRNDFELNLYLKNYNYLKEKKFKDLYKIASSKEKVRYFLLRNFCGVFLFLKRLKNGK